MIDTDAAAAFDDRLDANPDFRTDGRPEGVWLDCERAGARADYGAMEIEWEDRTARTTVSSMSDARVISESRVLPFAPEAIWAVIASPRGHMEMDGSGTVKGVARGPDELVLGSRFRMKMRLGLPYLMTSTVVEYDEHRLIAWAHFGKHRWRFELEPVDGGTKVTESFDWSTARSPRLIELVGYPDRHTATLSATLERLEAVVAERQG